MSTKKIRTIFIGTPDFAVPSLKTLIKDKQFDIISVITQPDKKVGRKHVLTPPAVKIEAEKYNIPVFQPDSIKNYKLETEDLDLIIVIAYAQIIPKNLLESPKFGTVNVHGSLLPYCRGAACIQQPIIDGKEKTGITIMQVDEGLDTGSIIAQKEIPILANDTAGTIFEKLSKLSGEFLVSTLKDYISGKLTPISQDDSQATYVKMLKKEDGYIDWKKSAEKIERFIRAMQPWPGAFSKIKDKSLKILKTNHKLFNINKYKPGKLFILENKLYVQCGKDALEIKILQIEGKKSMESSDFLCGYQKLVNTILK